MSDHPTRLFVGAMSGTSADGVDVALVRIAGRGLEMSPTLVRHHHRAYDAEIKRNIFDIRARGEARLADLANLGRQIALTYATAVNELLAMTRTGPSDVTAVAAHGQTLYHDPPNTIQWFDPSLLAAETGCAVVSDFRRADLAAGGQGAPLVPFADYILFRHPTKSRAIVNIGGIANVTCLPANGQIENVKAFDTGPGNCISDHLMRRYFSTGPGIDIDGNLALKGRVISNLSIRVEQHPYFSQQGPKSTDGPAMIEIYEEARRSIGPRAFLVEDELATACALAARGISCGARAVGENGPDEMIVSGGGMRNRAIMHWLRLDGRMSLDGCRYEVLTSDQLGLLSEAKEALAFALLGAATLDNVPSNVPSASGARRQVVLGSITPRP